MLGRDGRRFRRLGSTEPMNCRKIPGISRWGNELRRSKTAVWYVWEISQHVRYYHSLFFNLSEAHLDLGEATNIVNIISPILRANFAVVVTALWFQN